MVLAVRGVVQDNPYGDKLMITRRNALNTIAAAALAAGVAATAIPAKAAEDTIKVGVIDIPAFYIDFEAMRRGDKDYKSTTRDVKKLLQELQDEGV